MHQFLQFSRMCFLNRSLIFFHRGLNRKPTLCRLVQVIFFKILFGLVKMMIKDSYKGIVCPFLSIFQMAVVFDTFSISFFYALIENVFFLIDVSAAGFDFCFNISGAVQTLLQN